MSRDDDKDANSKIEYRKFQMSCAGRGIMCSLGFKQYAALRARPCFYCGVKRSAMTVGLISKEISAMGYCEGNVDTICRICFSLKGDFSKKQFLAILQKIQNHLFPEKTVIENTQNTKTAKTQKSNLGSIAGKGKTVSIPAHVITPAAPRTKKWVAENLGEMPGVQTVSRAQVSEPEDSDDYELPDLEDEEESGGDELEDEERITCENKINIYMVHNEYRDVEKTKDWKTYYRFRREHGLEEIN